MNAAPSTQTNSTALPGKDKRVALFIPCFIDQLYPQTGFNMVKVLEKVGCRVRYNSRQTCCGQPAWNSGDKPAAIMLAKKVIAEFEARP